MQLTKADILKAIREKNLTTFEQIQDETDAGTICGNCTADIEEILEEELKRQRSEKS
jgi:nitrite reductase (NADH) large subunit